jgi:hypothetical protein
MEQSTEAENSSDLDDLLKGLSPVCGSDLNPGPSDSETMEDMGISGNMDAVAGFP